MSWNDDIKKIMEIIPQIELLQSNANKPVKAEYDDSQIKAEIKGLFKTVDELHGDILSIKRHESSARTNQELAENFEQELLLVKAKLEKLKQVKPYDDSGLTERLSKLEQIKPQKYDDSKIKKEIEEVKSSIPKAYDDKQIKSAISQLLKHFESQNVTITALSKECDKISKLEDLIKSKDDNIKSLKLDLKRAESSARTCEELMVSMEKKVNDLSKRLKDGN